MSVIPANHTQLIPTEAELKSYQIIAKVASANPHWRKLGGNGGEETVVATILSVMLLARELGISPIQSISGGINNILGKFEISARIMNQLIRKHGHKLNVKMHTHEVCVIWGKRRDTGEEMEVRYHIEEAARAGLIKDGGGWRKCPEDMLFARAISRLARRLFPDCIGGCYVEGELQETMLKQPIDSVDVPRLEEVNVEIKETSTEMLLDIPNDISNETVEKFIHESSMTSGKTRDYVIKSANHRPQAFIDALRAWEDKNKNNENYLSEEQKIEILA